jgi:hypothetical protein
MARGFNEAIFGFIRDTRLKRRCGIDEFFYFLDTTVDKKEKGGDDKEEEEVVIR